MGKDHYWSIWRNGRCKYTICRKSGVARDAAVEYVTNLIKAHCIGEPQNLQPPLTFPNPIFKLKIYTIKSFAAFADSKFEHCVI